MPPPPTALIADAVSQMVQHVVGIDRAIAGMLAIRARVIDELRVASETADWEGTTRSRELTRMSLVAELACALRLPERTAGVLLDHSQALVAELPGTLAALERGEIGYRHAQVMVDHTRTLPPEGVAAVEEAALPDAESSTAAQFDRRARRLRERMHPESIAARRSRSEQDRAMFLSNERDGMASLSLYLTAPDAHAIHSKITDQAMALQGPGECRTLTQLRLDVARDLLLDTLPTRAGSGRLEPGGASRGRHEGIRPDVLVTVPIGTLLGSSEEPGELAGYGPIDPDSARVLAGRARSWRRIVTDPDAGVVLSFGRTRYRPSNDLKAWLRLRDGTCRFPGCSRAAAGCDIDHTQAWEHGGATDHDNLAHLCAKHHALKHGTTWAVNQEPGGSGAMTWTSPAGRTYRTEPDPPLPAAPPDKPHSALDDPTLTPDDLPAVSVEPTAVSDDPPF
jgi:AraC-like DNA-binding protein